MTLCGAAVAHLDIVGDLCGGPNTQAFKAPQDQPIGQRRRCGSRFTGLAAEARVAGIIRRADEGESLGIQERRIRGQAMADDLEVDAVFVDRGVSGSVPWSDRPEGARLFKLLGRGDQVIVASPDRAFRSASTGLRPSSGSGVKGSGAGC